MLHLARQPKPALIKVPTIGEGPSAARHGLLQLIYHSISINKTWNQSVTLLFLMGEAVIIYWLQGGELFPSNIYG